MTTVMQLYVRAIGLVLFIVVMLFALLMLAAPAFAQDAAPVAPEASTKDMIDLVFSSAAAGAMSLGAVLLAFLAKHLPGWLTPILDYITTSEADRWEKVVTGGLDRAEAYARTMGADALKDRSGWINMMAVAIDQFNPEIVRFFDKNNNGIIDQIEGYIPPKGVTPGLVSLIATRLPAGSVTPSKKAAPADPVQTLMAATQRRGVRTKEVAN